MRKRTTPEKPPVTSHAIELLEAERDSIVSRLGHRAENIRQLKESIRDSQAGDAADKARLEELTAAIDTLRGEA